MFFCTGVGRKNVVLVEELRVRGSWNTNVFFSSNYIKGRKRFMKCSLVQEFLWHIRRSPIAK